MKVWKCNMKQEPVKSTLTNNLPAGQLILSVIRLSIPAIFAQLSSVAMQYIDSAMVGSLGANASAAIGLVSTSTWLVGGLCTAFAAGFSVQVAQLIGAEKNTAAKNVFRQSLAAALIFGCVLAAAGAAISRSLPVWLGGDTAIHGDAFRYFLIYSLALPFVQVRQLSGGMLQSSGDMKTPSILNAAMCGFDILFNALLIFPGRDVAFAGISLHIPGANLGVTGAALGTALSEVVTAMAMLHMACFRSKTLHLKGGGSWKIQKKCLKTALRIALPVAMEHTAMCGAQVASTKIIAPLGTVSVAANSLAVTAESFCYMPGYGIGTAATTLVGQSIGAGKTRLAKRYAWIAVLLGTLVMTAMGAIMFGIAPLLLSWLTPVQEVRALGTGVLRIEAFAEPFYAISIVASGALRGAGDTLVPGLMNLCSMWGVRITAAALLTPHFGLAGVWIAMCGELCVRGILFLIRLLRGKWLQIQVMDTQK